MNGAVRHSTIRRARTAAQTVADIATVVAVSLYSAAAATFKNALWRPAPPRCDTCGQKITGRVAREETRHGR